MEKLSKGWLHGFIGVSIFAGSLPATRVAVAELAPNFLTSARATIAALLGLLFLWLLKQPLPKREQITPLMVSALGVVVGFPLLTAMALQFVTSAHSIVFVGLLPLCTAMFAVLRGNERPKWAFWVFSVIGAATVAGYAAWGNEELNLIGDALMLAAIILCGLGYAEGAKLTKTLGGWQAISWSLIVALPFMLPILVISWPQTFQGVSQNAWLGLAYVSVFSMMIGFVFWYKGLALGGIAAVGQLQLIQPFIGLVLAAWLLNETVSPAMVWVTLVAIVCVACAKRFAK